MKNYMDGGEAILDDGVDPGLHLLDAPDVGQDELVRAHLAGADATRELGG